MKTRDNIRRATWFKEAWRQQKLQRNVEQEGTRPIFEELVYPLPSVPDECVDGLVAWIAQEAGVMAYSSPHRIGTRTISTTSQPWQESVHDEKIKDVLQKLLNEDYSVLHLETKKGSEGTLYTEISWRKDYV